ncbi:hypothetical protein YB2330_005126 [Saitoella coloradoensis]
MTATATAPLATPPTPLAPSDAADGGDGDVCATTPLKRPHPTPPSTTTTTTTPLSKRQRANIARSTLRKPFISPLKPPGSHAPKTQLTRPTTAAAAAAAAGSSAAALTMPSTSPPTLSPPPTNASTPPSATSYSAYTPLKPRSVLSRPRPRPSRPKFNSPANPTHSSHPALLPLHNHRLHLEKSITQTLSAIETATTARKYELKNEDARLEELVRKFRRAGQEAADHMFGLMNDRVNRMGGIRKPQPRRACWGDEDEGGGGLECPEGVDGDEWRYILEERKKEMEEQRDPKEEAHDDDDLPSEEDGDGASFTMGMMLKQMGIPLEMIGWDKDSETWVPYG